MISEMLLQSVDVDEHARLVEYAQAWRMYCGDYQKPLRVRPGQFDDNVICNFVRVIVDASVAFLFGREVSFDTDELRETEAERYLAQVWESNGKMLLLQQAALNGAICGHCFIKIVPRTPFPKLVVLDPATVTVHWNPRDVSEVRRYIITYSAKDFDTEQMVTYREVIEREGMIWRVTESVSEGDTSRWQVVTSDLWRWSFPPVVDCQNLPLPNSYYGQPDVTRDIIALNNALNFVLSNMNRIVRYHAHPRVWGRGVAAARLDVAVDEAILLPNSDAELRVLEMQSDLGSSINLYLRLKEALHEMSRTPEVALGKLDSIGAVSGIALRVLYQPLLQKTESKRRTYGAMLQELNRRLLAMAGYGEDVTCTVHWQEPMEADDGEIAKTALMWQQLGVSEDTILQKLGFDPQLEKEKREANSRTFGEQLLTAFERGQ